MKTGGVRRTADASRSGRMLSRVGRGRVPVCRSSGVRRGARLLQASRRLFMFLQRCEECAPAAAMATMAEPRGAGATSVQPSLAARLRPNRTRRSPGDEDDEEALPMPAATAAIPPTPKGPRHATRRDDGIVSMETLRGSGGAVRCPHHRPAEPLQKLRKGAVRVRVLALVGLSTVRRALHVKLAQPSKHFHRPERSIAMPASLRRQ